MGSVNKVDMASAYEAGKSIPQLAEEHGIPRSRVRQGLLEEGVTLRSRVDGMRMAIADGRRPNRGGKYQRSEATRAKLSASRIAAADLTARGVRQNSNGYIEYTRGPRKGRMVHDVIAESIIGRPLRPDEVVHHIDRNRANNNPANLEVMTRSQHTSLHRRERQSHG